MCLKRLMYLLNILNSIINSKKKEYKFYLINSCRDSIKVGFAVVMVYVKFVRVLL